MHNVLIKTTKIVKTQTLIIVLYRPSIQKVILLLTDNIQYLLTVVLNKIKKVFMIRSVRNTILLGCLLLNLSSFSSNYS